MAAFSSRLRGAAPIVGAALLLTSCAPSRPQPTPSQPRHVFVIVMENHTPDQALEGPFTASLVMVNFNLWALAAVPLILLATRVELRVPRLRWLFYALYPIHLTVLWWLRDGLHWPR